MDSFFGIGFPELVMILILAGIVMGPQRIRSVARQLGRFVAQMQDISNQFKRQLNAELDALDATEVKDAVDDVRALQQELRSLRKEVTRLSDETVREGREAVEAGERMLKKPVVPPPTVPEISTEAKSGPEAEPDDNPSATRLPQPISVPDDPE